MKIPDSVVLEDRTISSTLESIAMDKLRQLSKISAARKMFRSTMICA